MPEPLTGLSLTKERYESLAPAAAYGERLFPSWIEWNKLQMRAAGAALKTGLQPGLWTIDVEAFHDWCARVGATPCIDELRIYSQTPGARRAVERVV